VYDVVGDLYCDGGHDDEQGYAEHEEQYHFGCSLLTDMDVLL
jgi:hypothetical protein